MFLKNHNINHKISNILAYPRYAIFTTQVINLRRYISSLAHLDSHFAFEFDPEVTKGKKFYYEFATLVDKRSQIIFPATFVFFMTIYWGILFCLAEKADDVLIDAIPYAAIEL